MILSDQTTQTIRRLLAGGISTEEFGRWLVSADDDETLLEGEQAALTHLRLSLLEYGEGLREMEEILSEAAGLLDAAELLQARQVLATGSTNVTLSSEGVEAPVSFREERIPA